MEPISFTVGILPLFSVCLEYFEYFKTAQSLPYDLEILMLKLDLEHERFVAWGEINGFSKTRNDDQNPILDNQQKTDLIKRGLESIQSLFENSNRLQTDYGVRHIDKPSIAESTPKFPGSFGLTRFRKSRLLLNKGSDSEKKPSLLLRTKWAIHDKAKFEMLISDIRDLVNGIYNILPVSNKERDKIAFKDIKALLPDLRRLKQLELASEAIYPTWSEAASVMIMASESGTANGRGSVGEWVVGIHDSKNESEHKSNKGPRIIGATNSTHSGFDLSIPIYNSKAIYFVFTSTCLSEISGTSCNDKTLGLRSLDKKGPNFLPRNSRNVKWSLGKRLTDAVNPQFDWESLQILQQNNYEFPDIQKLALESSLPSEKVDIYCAPCACAIQTAIRICSHESTKLIQYLTKVDDRIPVSCCPETSKMACLSSLLVKIQEDESGLLTGTPGLETSWIQYIDRVWIEQRIYTLETQLYDRETYKPIHDSINELLSTFPGRNSVFLGELDQCLWILQTPPFPWTPRMPKENEIYELQKNTKADLWEKKFLGTFTPRNFRTSVYPTSSSTAKNTHHKERGNSTLGSSELDTLISSPKPARTEDLIDEVDHDPEADI